VLENESLGVNIYGDSIFSVNGANMSSINVEEGKESKVRRRKLAPSILDLKKDARLSDKDRSALI